MEDLEIIKEFLIESSENLARLDNELVELERRPNDRELLASIFRTVHTIKGTCGFLGFSTLGSITHEAETILAQLRDGKRVADPDTVSLILETVDATRAILKAIEENGEEGGDFKDDLLARLKQAATGQAPVPAKPVPVEAAPAPVPGPAPAPMPAPAPAPPPVEAPPPPPLPVPAAVEPPAPMVAAAPPAQVLTAAPPAQVLAAAPPAPEAQDAPAPEAAASSVADSAIRVDVGLLGKLMNLVGELVLVRNRILQSSQAEGVALSAAAQRLNLITTELQEGVMKTRMQPIGGVWGKLPRATRDIARSLGKQIRLEMDGAETELDKTIIEAIKDPLTHLVRNSCDHGIERPEERVAAGKPAQGKIRLRAYHEGGQVNIEIIDDGGGIDAGRLRRKAVERGILRQDQADRLSEREALNLVFHPGFSTAESVTSVSGRGVGMDVVKSNIERIGGVVDLASQRGEGTTVRLKIPLTLAIIPGLLVTSGGERFVVPQVSLLELMRLDGAQQIEWVHGTPVFRRRGTLLPIAFLNDVLRLGRSADSGTGNLIVLQAEDRQFGLVVDAINDTQEIVVKPLGVQLKRLPVYAGATIMGDGKVALILDVVGVAQSAGVFAAAAVQSLAAAEERKPAQAEAQRLLLFRAGTFERLAVPLSLVARLEEFSQASIERAGGSQVVQYRGRLLPLFSLATLLDGFASADAAADPAQVIVFQDGERTIGLLIDQVIDIVEETVTLRRQSANPNLLGSGVVSGKVVDFLNLQAVLQAAGSEWSGQRAPKLAAATVVLAEASPFSRGLLRGGLESAGYQVLEAASAPEVLRLLDHSRADVVVTSLDLPPDGGHSLLDAIRRQTELERLPALALTDSSAERPPRAEGRAEFDDYQEKSDWQAMVGSVERLCAALSGGAPLAAEETCHE